MTFDAGASAKETDPLIADKQAFCENYHGPVAFLNELVKNFGSKLVILLFFVQHLRKGFAEGLLDAATPYLFESYGVPAPTAQIFRSVVRLPWAMKPVIGLASDVFPLFGYKKAAYMVLTSVLALVAMAYIGTASNQTMAVQVCVLCIFLASMQCSTSDLLSEAIYAERIQEKPAHGPDMLSYVWFGLTAAGLISASISGYVIGEYGPRAAFSICSIPAAMVLLPVLAGYLEETRVTAEAAAALRRHFFQQKEACLLCLLMLVATVSLTVCGITLRDPVVNGCLAICLLVIVVSAFTVVLSPPIAKFNAYSVIQSSFALSISGASFYFYTDTAEQYPEGPHFTPYFYNTVMGVCGSLFSLLGIFMYNRYMAGWRYRYLLLMANLFFSTLCLVDILMFTRVNVKFGIPDHVFMLSSGVLESVVYMWMWMPQVVIFSYLCPKGMEATMYALLAGCANLGNSIASNVGAMLLHLLGCHPSGAVGESEEFKNLWLIALIATLLPALTIGLIFWLVPDSKQGDPILNDGCGRDSTTGSLWRRWSEGEEAAWQPRC